MNMKYITIGFVLAAALTYALTARADVFYLNWLKPTERTDNTPLLPEEIKAYELYINGDPVDKLIPGTMQEHEIDLPNPGLYLLELITIDTEGRVSTSMTFPPMEVLKPVTPPKPPRKGTWKRKTQ